jgi:uncharacterized SAM-binding protein YcdF (DUF218 family)
MTHRSGPRRLITGGLLVLLVAWIASAVAVVDRARRDEARPADAIVVLGAAQYAGRPSPVLRARLDHAIDLWKQGLAPTLVLTGGTGAGDTTSEAAVGKRYAIKQGVPAAAIQMETEGRTTIESLQGVAALRELDDHPTVILVSDPFHMLRLSILARRLGMIPLTSPTRTSPISENRTQVVRYILSESVKAPLAFIMEWTRT